MSKHLSSTEHCHKALAAMRLMVRPQRLSEAETGEQMAGYARALAEYPPDVVTRTCEAWAKRHAQWPALADLLALAVEQGASDGPKRSGEVTPMTGLLAGLARAGWDAVRLAQTGYAASEIVIRAGRDGASIEDTVARLERLAGSGRSAA